MTTPRTPAESVQGALSDLRAAVAAVSSNGQIGKKAEELSKRVDDLGKHVTEKGGKDAGKHIEDLEKYLRELSKKGELTASGEQRLVDALQTVRERAAEA
jgi:predicted RNase H-like nuclease (RuvC/YqgF family)